MEQSILMIATDSTYQFYFSKMLPHRLANRRLRENQPNEKGKDRIDVMISGFQGPPTLAGH